VFSWVANNHRAARASSTTVAAWNVRGARRTRAGLALLGILWLPIAPAAGQGVPASLRPRVASRADLAALLASPAEPPLTPDLRAALVASLGQPAVGWALELATDTSGSTGLAVRAGALRVLRYARWRAAVPSLLALARPYDSPWLLWHGALAALSSYPYPELAGFWREEIQFPRRPVREVAVLGLALTGTERDRAIIAEEWQGERDPEMLRLRERAEALLAVPAANRDTATFAWPPDSTGRFVPSRSWLASLERQICGAPAGCARH